ncbi:unnamed protein product [Heligmosomoides polygyrus]|uniref:Beta-lactamase domain-containing protein n=1 Tax=Heligmosomoides polygyrus TaxID=6339 RepID=A0A183FKM6_HELPZ|nr:unnamed protein product [Heligmosomoides polygyrus]
MKNFTGEFERAGAALTVIHKGKVVTDVWGGLADCAKNIQWIKNTFAGLFCCTKSLAAICVAMKVDRGECDYSDKVTKFWPEFGQHNKGEITIEMILTHRVSIPFHN